MRIAYDNIIFSLQAAGGISVYWAELIKNLQQADVAATFHGPRVTNQFGRALPITVERESRLPLQILRYLPFTSWLPKGSLFHSSYYRVSLQPGVTNIVTVYDFTYERFSKGLRKHVHTQQKAFALRHADGIICISEKTREDLLAYYPRLNVPIAAIPLGVSESFSRLDDREAHLRTAFPELVGKRFVLFVGARTHYKNFDAAVEAVAAARGDLHLAFVGGGPVTHEHARLLDSRLPGRYVHCAQVNDQRLNVLYNGAHCFMYPSSYEGFGLPLLEAMRAGCPIVTMRAASIPGVVGDAALMVDQPDVAQLAAKLEALELGNIRMDLIEKGLKRAQQFSWPICFRRTYEFYREVASAVGGGRRAS